MVEEMNDINLIAIIISGITLFVTIINQIIIIKDHDAQLSFSLREYNGLLYLKVINTGKKTAKKIKITINKMHNNGSNQIIVDPIYKIPFELGAEEVAQGIVGNYEESLAEHVFPYIDIEVKYKNQGTLFYKKYKRKIFFISNTEDIITVKTRLNLENIEHSLNNIHKDNIRLANYFDGCEIAAFDELNIISDNHFQKDMLNIQKSKKSNIYSRTESIEKRINQKKSR